MQQILGLPEHVVPVAYLCLGYVSHFKDSPELEQKGWRKRKPLEELIMFEQWNNQQASDPLLKKLSQRKNK